MPAPVASKRVPPHPGWRTLWLCVAILVAVAETGALRSVLVGDTLSETVWWLYGEPYALRWWVLGCCVAGPLTWAAAHFMWPHIAGWHLIAVQAAALIVALGGWALTR